ncbi:hypothetical protein SAMN05421737_109123 [Shouchella lonarensis]|uniref:Uncharacterized protein n=1 Tax=Shouchella lonarensis TaxID=1464122 RepID=A0A1G6M826_9BACI|nr:hypothetical protein SAMN05421737_109123 [Shouchella lonarensis]
MEHISTSGKKVIKENVVFEKDKVNQGQLYMGYRTYATCMDDDYEAMRVVKCIFSGSLIKVVCQYSRERKYCLSC